MAFNFHEKKQEIKKEIKVKDPSLELTKPEIELILRLLAQTTFQVKDIETLYIALWKLEETHKQLN